MSSNKEILCYAASIGDCSGGQSTEHYVSQCLFSNNMLTLSGQNWLNGEEKTISYKKAGLKILCVHHNKSLLPIDKAGCIFFRCLNDCATESFMMAKLPRSSLKSKKVYRFNGFDIERWMAKAAVGVTFEDKKLRWHLRKCEQNKPPKEIVESVFGLNKLKYPMGLYHLPANDKVVSEERAGLTTLMHPESGGYVGSIINLSIYHCLVWLCDESFEDKIFNSYTGALFGKVHNQPMYHQKEIRFTGKGKIWSKIHIDW